MNFLNPHSVWQADNLPDGLTLHNGVISGSPTSAGSFTVPVSVSNPLGHDFKNITIYVKHRPGTEKFSIQQDGTEVARLTIPELQAMVQDGSAQSQFNCSNTQIILPLLQPELKYIDYDQDDNYVCLTRPASSIEVALNFCAFRNSTLQDGSVRPSLILQFDKSLWKNFAPFDTNKFNRWKYSNLRQWLNASGSNWFSPAYDGDKLISWQESAIDVYKSLYSYDPHSSSFWARYQQFIMWQSTYADDNVPGFLDLLHDDINNILVPIKIVTQAFFDDNNSNPSIDDPDDVDGYDADITYDKVFIPSLKEMQIGFNDPTAYGMTAEKMQEIAQEGVEGDPWDFWSNKLSAVAYSTFTNKNYDWIKAHNGEWPYYVSTYNESGEVWYSPFSGLTDFFEAWGNELDNESVDIMHESLMRQAVLTRTAVKNSSSGIWSIFRHYDSYFEYDDLNLLSTNYYANPAPAFAIC